MPAPVSSDAKQIFISYSRADAPYARTLAEALTTLGFTLWRDRSDMEGGENWWQQIEEAIRGVDTMILLLSDAALGSKIVSRRNRARPHRHQREHQWSGLHPTMRVAHPGWRSLYLLPCRLYRLFV